VDDRVTTSPPLTPNKPPAPVADPTSALLHRLTEPLALLGDAAFFAIRATLALPAVLLRPGELLTQLYRILVGALHLAITAGAAIGIIVWIQLRGALQSAVGPSALPFLPQGLSLGVVLLLGPVTAGLLTAARSGASLGAELGAMRLTEQIDALEVLGLSPMRELVAPRVAACMLAQPVLTTFIIYLALGSGYLAEALGGSMTMTQYFTECLRVLRLNNVLPAILQTLVLGYLVGLIGCWFGMNARGGTEGVGRAATGGVVVSLFGVLVAEVALVKIIQLVF
jgi:phospholipid/cholesterol/gamma-HCH transport system permease protein